MRTAVITSICLVLLGLASASAQQKQTTSAMRSGKAVLEAYVSAWNRHDFESLDKLLTPDAVHEDVAQGVHAQGLAEIEKFMREEIEGEPDLEWCLTTVVDAGPVVAAEWTWTGTFTGESPAGPVKAQRILGRGASVVVIENGRIKYFTDYYDLANFFSKAPTGSATSNKEIEDHIISLERTLWSGNANDISKLEADDYEAIKHAHRYTRADDEAAAKEASFALVAMDDIRVRMLRPEVALMTYHATERGTFRGTKVPPSLYFASLWVNRGGEWKNVFLQENLPDAFTDTFKPSADAPVRTQQSATAAHSETKLDTAKIDAVLGRSGIWTIGAYLVDFFRPDVRVTLQGVQLVPGHVDSFATFMGTDDNAEIMGEVCALPGEVTAATEKLRATGLQITGIHNHFLGESPRLMFIHFMAHGRASELARAFRDALANTTTPLGKVPPPRVSPAPDWAKTVQTVLGHEGSYSADYGWLDVEFPRADFPAGPTDFWYTSGLFFQEALGGKIAATGDLAVTADELNRALSVLTERQFEILGVHNHMIDEQPRLFFLHFWKVGAAEELATGLKAALAVVHTRSVTSESANRAATQPSVIEVDSEEPRREQTLWNLEHAYWRYVQDNDLSAYLGLWDKDFLGWPSVSAQPVHKDHITDWITSQTSKGLRLKLIDFKPAAIRSPNVY